MPFWPEVLPANSPRNNFSFNKTEGDIKKLKCFGWLIGYVYCLKIFFNFMDARRKKLPLKSITIDVREQRNHGIDWGAQW